MDTDLARHAPRAVEEHMIARVIQVSKTVAPIALALVVGCGGKPVHVIDVGDNARLWQTQHVPTPHAKVAASITVRVVGRPSMGVVTYLPPTPAIVVPVGGDDDADNFKAALNSDPKAVSGIFVKGYGTAMQVILKDRLSEYFDNVTVELSPDPAPSGVISVTPTGLALIPGFYTRTAGVELTARLPDGATFKQLETPDSASAAGHLGWALPAGLITFPIGVPFIGMGFSGIYKGLEEAKTIEAMDMDVVELAGKLARMAGSPSPSAPVQPPAPHAAQEHQGSDHPPPAPTRAKRTQGT
jgi:hypothetical protein